LVTARPFFFLFFSFLPSFLDSFLPCKRIHIRICICIWCINK
jgi:hypothetical protein